MIKVLKLKIVDEYEKVYKIRRKNNIKIHNYEEYLKETETNREDVRQ